MIRVSVPIDLSAVAAAASPAFALATPLRVGDVLAAAIAEGLGRHAPRDKRERVLARVRAAFEEGDFALEIDGRRYADPDEVVVCAGTATVRFFRRRDDVDDAA